ncbi:MAG: hypothetical protein IT449_19055 [Phycisphaerales bacterium]|nr:hypothetical protein [Phycisphaerales bacterium]
MDAQQPIADGGSQATESRLAQPSPASPQAPVSSETPPGAPGVPHQARHNGLRVPILAAIVAIVLQTILTPLTLLVWPIVFPDQIVDDAYMFLRYADRMAAEGRICWNPGGPLTYGLTSPLYGVWVCVVRWLFPGDPSRIMTLAALGPALCLLPLMLAVLARAARKTGAATWAALLALLLVMRSPFFNHLILVHGFTGMDTTFAALYVAACLSLWRRLHDSPTRGRTWTAGLSGAFTFLVRPDLLVFPAGALLGLGFLSVDAAERRASRISLVIMGAGLAVIALTAWLVFGTPVPLSFYAKNTAAYGEGFAAAYAGVSASELNMFWKTYAPLLVLAGLYALSLAAPRRARLHALDAGMVVGVGAFIVYQRFLLLPVMHYYQRFLVPALPVLVWLAWCGLWEVTACLRSRVSDRAANGCLRGAAGAGACVTGFVLFSWTPVERGFESGEHPGLPSLLDTSRTLLDGVARGEFSQFDITANYRARFGGYWHRLDEFSKLPDDLCIATTEVGYPGVMNPGKRIIDLAGLNDTRLMLGGFDMEAMLLRERPDLIYMPYPDYKGLVRALREAPTFREDYEEFAPESLGNKAFGLALRRAGAHYHRLREITLVKSSPR